MVGRVVSHGDRALPVLPEDHEERTMKKGPGGFSRWHWAKSWLRYRWDQVRASALNKTGFCSSCPKRPRGSHKFGCYRRPGKGLRFTMKGTP